MPLGDEQRDPQQGIVPDLVERVSRVAIPKVPSPTAQEGIDLRDDLFDRRGEPARIVKEPDAVSGMLRP